MPLVSLGVLMVGEFADGEIVIHHKSWAKLTNLDSILLYSTRDRTLDSYDRDFCLPQLKQPQTMAKAIEVVDQFFKEWAAEGREVVYRATWCFECKSGLDSFNHKQCSKCGWLICSCGACGCHFVRVD